MDRAALASLLSLLPALLPVREAAAAPPRLALEVAEGQRAAAAEALFDQGRRLMSAGRYAEACARFADSERIDHGVGTLLNLADCYEKSGQTASAWAGFRAVSAAASAEGQPARERIARERELAIQPLLAHLTIALPPGLPAGAEVRRDGISLGRSLWGSPVPVDPGDHTVLVAAPGKIDYLATVHVPRAPGAAVVARVPGLRDRPASASASEARPGRSPRATAGLILLGLGGAGVVVGSIFGVRALGLKGDSSSSCRADDHCAEEGLSQRASARAAGTASTAAFIAGGVLVAGGLALTVTAPERQRVTASAGFAGGTAGVTLGATW